MVWLMVEGIGCGVVDVEGIGVVWLMVEGIGCGVVDVEDIGCGVVDGGGYRVWCG